MEIAVGVLSTLLKPLLSIASEEWDKTAEFKTLRHLAYERLSRELHWNAECLWKLNDDCSNGYIELVRTEAFDSLVSASVPLDSFLKDPVRDDWLESEPYSSPGFKHRIESCEITSDLIDRVYSRLWMLKHMREDQLEDGDISYLNGLLLFTLAHINMGRRKLAARRSTFRRLILQAQPVC